MGRLLLLLLALLGLALGLPQLHQQDEDLEDEDLEVEPNEEDEEEGEEEVEEEEEDDLEDEPEEDESEPHFGLGLLEPEPEDILDEESVGYFNTVEEEILVSGDGDIQEYSAIKEGLVSSVKNQGDCGSCAAFATIAAMEVCFKKITKQFGDYSEQQLLDCGFKYKNAQGCLGAPQHAYVEWLADLKPELTSEQDYPYREATASCPSSLPTFDQGARVTKNFYTYDGTEMLLTQLVLRHGAAVVTLYASDKSFIKYTGGIYANCEEGKRPNHAVTVVGFGQEKGEDFWLIKNSWGPKWGEEGFMRLRRGVGMCGIGKSFSALECEATSSGSSGGGGGRPDKEEEGNSEEETRPRPIPTRSPNILNPILDFLDSVSKIKF